ncbi:M20 family metallopeptidase [Taklimakanibacter deserti]|uniref:M20 family metallopeptidase n=1 Tax=Taklimakanibacter deserti TaxID=2267839 RepID=UPI0013C41539
MDISTDGDYGARVDRALDVEGMIAACQAVIRVPSLSYEEAAVAHLCAEHLRKLGFDEVEIDRNGNVIGRLRGAGNGPSLMINGHIDHVPPGEMVDPYSGEIVDAARWGETGPAIRGRGTCDMKCNVMASAYAVSAIKRAGLRLNGDIVFVADVAEEVDSPTGVVSVIERGIRADYGLNTESTRGHVHIGHRGKIDCELEVHGRTSHASEPANGLNAAYQAVPLLDALRRYAEGLGDDPLLGPATVTVISVRSSPDNGTAVVPDRCVVRVDRRYVRGETAESCEAELRALIAGVAESVPDFTCDFRLITHYPLMHVPPGNPVVEAALAARKEAIGAEDAPGAWRFGVNGTFMCQAGIPTVGLGPGNEKWAHTPDEHIGIDDLTETCSIWMRLIMRICGVVKE